MKAFLFPGQGSQSVGMGKDLIEGYDIAKDIYKQADDILGFSLSELCFDGSVEELTKTENAQPAILTYSHIVTEILKSKGITSDFVAGHSLGEFSALLAANMLTYEDALKVVRKRGELMAAADPDGKGGMAAVIGLEDNEVEAVCEEISKESYVVPVNYNTPGQVVISGLKEGIKIALTKMEDAGAMRVIELSVSGAFHSRLMEPAADKFAEFLKTIDFKKPSCKVVSNVTAEFEDETNVRDLLVAQMKSPVLWVKSVQFMKAQGVTDGIEAGSGRIIAGMVRKIDRELKVIGWAKAIEG